MSESQDMPTTKADLLHELRQERLSWDNLIATIPDDIATEPTLPDGSSVKDLLAHIAAYERWTAAQIRAANEGREPTTLELYGRVDMPEDALTWDLDQVNAAIREQHKDLSLEAAREVAGTAFNDLLSALEATPEEDFVRPGAQAWIRERTLVAAVPGQSYAHCAAHLDDLRTVAGRMA